MKFFSATYQAFIPVSHPHQSKSIAQIVGPKIITINFGVISELTPKTAMFFLAFSPNWCHGARPGKRPISSHCPWRAATGMATSAATAPTRSGPAEAGARMGTDVDIRYLL